MSKTDANAGLPALRIAMPASAKSDFEVSEARWRTLIDAVFPSAQSPEAVMLALDYCKANNLDVMKRPVHIVPVWNSELRRTVETIWPGIGSYRIVAHRTESYAGMDECAFGPTRKEVFEGEIIKRKGREIVSRRTIKREVEYPEWAQITVYRLVKGQVRKFPGPRVRYTAMFAGQAGARVPNDKWAEDSFWMLEKTAESAALRRAFPEALGNWETIEEAERRIVDVTPAAEQQPDADAQVADTVAEIEDASDTLTVVDHLGEAISVTPESFHQAFIAAVTGCGKREWAAMALVAANTVDANTDEDGVLHKTVAMEFREFDGWMADKSGKDVAAWVNAGKPEPKAKTEPKPEPKPEPKEDKKPVDKKPEPEPADVGYDGADDGSWPDDTTDEGGEDENSDASPENSAAGGDKDESAGGDAAEAENAPTERDWTARIPFPDGVPSMVEIKEWIGAAENSLARLKTDDEFKAWRRGNEATYKTIRDAVPEKLAAVDELMARFP